MVDPYLLGFSGLFIITVDFLISFLLWSGDLWFDWRGEVSGDDSSTNWFFNFFMTFSFISSRFCLSLVIIYSGSSKPLPFFNKSFLSFASFKSSSTLRFFLFSLHIQRKTVINVLINGLGIYFSPVKPKALKLLQANPFCILRSNSHPFRWG